MKKNVTILCGASGTGKNYIADYLISNYNFTPLISHTTRPIRPNETNGIDYHFISEKQFLNMIKDNQFIEHRTYNTLVNNIPATWHYGLAQQLLSDSKQYVVILDMQGTRDFIKWYGIDKCNIVMITCDTNIRRERAKLRGGYEEEEFNRRLEDDKRVFSVDNMLGLIDYTIENNSTLEDLQLKCEVLVDKLINV